MPFSCMPKYPLCLPVVRKYRILFTLKDTKEMAQQDSQNLAQYVRLQLKPGKFNK